ncbi:Endoplasmic Reticulum Membrane Sensor Nfe2L1 [Manis pentadactyla]|nr:Endoplasmic Reticulum Membrane Sensor Nfe2L1 [Manis pentadactyla]
MATWVGNSHRRSLDEDSARTGRRCKRGIRAWVRGKLPATSREGLVTGWASSGIPAGVTDADSLCGVKPCISRSEKDSQAQGHVEEEQLLLPSPGEAVDRLLQGPGPLLVCAVVSGLPLSRRAPS